MFIEYPTTDAGILPDEYFRATIIKLNKKSM